MKRILITRPRAQATEFAQKLQIAGFEPIYFPVIEIQAIQENIALERALSKLNCYDWFVFSSANAVDVVFNQFSSLVFCSYQQEDRVKVAAIGPKTADALIDRGITPDFVPEEYVAEAILPGLGDLLGKWVLLPRAEIARKELPELIFNAGGVPHEITVYKTLPAQPNLEGLLALHSGIDIITLTSASTVQNFIATLENCGLDPQALPNDPIFACIGPITEQAAKEAGLPNVVVAKEYTTDGLLTIMKNLEVI
jgi:uroporphyrinogen III methyltransferase / synthase